MQQSILSAGIDLGTTTSQVIFSRITLEDHSFTAVPAVRIKKKEVLYRSRIHFTPLAGGDIIDIPAVRTILDQEYALAGIRRSEITTGAVIITGETARKENARQALMGLSAYAGDFVVAAAGPDLESVLAGHGAGAATLSKTHEAAVANFDIGGGTTNTAVFRDGRLQDSFALDIGGRLIRLAADYRITYLSERIRPLLMAAGSSLREGMIPDIEDLKQLTDRLGLVLLKICRGGQLAPEEAGLFIGHRDRGSRLSAVMFSGGVAECIYGAESVSTLAGAARFGDIGPLLGASIRRIFQSAGDIELLQPRERIRATVIGAGSSSVSLSGSTVVMDDACVPLRNIPVIRLEESDDRPAMAADIRLQRRIYEPGQQVAIAFAGSRAPGYEELRRLADMLVEATAEDEHILLVLVEEDFAKALGLLLRQRAGGRKVICLDRIRALTGDYIDIGKSVAGVVPVVVKTLIFKK